MVVVKVGGASMPCLPGEGRSVLPFLLGIFMNSSVESLVTVHYRSGGPPWKGPMTMTPEPSLGGEALAAESVSDELEIPKQMVLPRKKPSHNKHSSLASAPCVDDGTIGTSRGKARCKSPFLACQQLVFFAPPRYTVVKIVGSYSDVALQTMKNYKAHYSLSWFRPLL
jgi:hypothetical protein